MACTSERLIITRSTPPRASRNANQWTAPGQQFNTPSHTQNKAQISLDNHKGSLFWSFCGGGGCIAGGGTGLYSRASECILADFASLQGVMVLANSFLNPCRAQTEILFALRSTQSSCCFCDPCFRNIEDYDVCFYDVQQLHMLVRLYSISSALLMSASFLTVFLSWLCEASFGQ